MATRREETKREKEKKKREKQFHGKRKKTESERKSSIMPKSWVRNFAFMPTRKGTRSYCSVPSNCIYLVTSNLFLCFQFYICKQWLVVWDLSTNIKQSTLILSQDFHKRRPHLKSPEANKNGALPQCKPKLYSCFTWKLQLFFISLNPLSCIFLYAPSILYILYTV